MSNKVTSVGADFPKQQKRVRDILKQYHRIAPQGTFGAQCIEDIVTQAAEAIAGGDVVQILLWYSYLCEIKE